MSAADNPFQRRTRIVPFAPELTEKQLDQLVSHPVFDRLDPAFREQDPFRAILQKHSRIVECDEGDIIIREGDWGNSAFFILDGKVAVELEETGRFLSPRELGRRTPKRKTLVASLLEALRFGREPETRDASTYEDVSPKERGTTTFLQDVPRILHDFKTESMGPGELFGEMAALGRSARTATVFAETNARLLEIRWQGLRDIRRKDRSENGFRKLIDDVFRKNALSAFLLNSELLKQLTHENSSAEDQHQRTELLEELRRKAELREFGEYDDVGGYAEAIQKSIVSEGDYPDGVFLVRNGVARISQRHHNGDQTLSYLTPGKMFGFHEIVEGWRTGEAVPYCHSLSALGYLMAVFIPTSVVEKLLNADAITKSAQQAHHPLGHQATPDSPMFRDNRAAAVDEYAMDFLVRKGFVNGTQAMIINLDRCTRCDDCVRACADSHDDNPRFLRQGPIHQNIMVAHACMHCRDPVCMIECPTGAISRQIAGSDQGVVTINDRTCIGCQACATNCPYDAIRMVEIRDSSGAFIRTKEDNKTIKKATKCDLCVDQHGGPACQRACPHDALVRLDLGDASSMSAWLQR